MIDIKTNEIPKHRKKKVKSNKKSNHKHLYKQCLIKEKDKTDYHIGEYCTICGRVNNVKFFMCFKNERGFYQSYTNEELLEKYGYLEIKEIEDLFKSHHVLL